MKKEQTDLERALIGSLFEARAVAKHFVEHSKIAIEALNCPRCDAPLTEHLPGPRWRRYFECRECWLAFSFYTGRLQPGRDPNPTFLERKERCRQI